MASPKAVAALMRSNWPNARVPEARLVQDILDRSRIVNGRLRLEPQIVSVSDVLRAAVEQMRPTFDHHHLQLTTTIRDAQDHMSADPVRLQQVFTNLLSNAVKFTPHGGHIAVEASCTSSTVVVTIRDDGVHGRPAPAATAGAC